MKKPAIHVWAPGMADGSGGIQAFSRAYVKALLSTFPNHQIKVILKNDQLSGNDELLGLGVQVRSVSNLHPTLRTLGLALTGLLAALRDRPVCLLATHLHFLPALKAIHFVLRIPFSAVLHGIEAWNLPEGARVRALRAADHLIAVSRFTRDTAIALYGLEPSRIGVVPNTFNPTQFSIGPKPDYLLKRHGLTPDQPILITVSRLEIRERYKGHRQVFAALKRLLPKFPSIHYVVAGNGDDVPWLRDAVNAHGLEGHVTITGQVPPQELADYYRLCDIFVMPSSKEGFGIVFLEAMASGKPVIAGNVDGSVDALADGELGVLVDPRDPDEISTTISSVLDQTHPNRLLYSPKQLRAAAAKRFGFTEFTRQLQRELTPLISEVSLLETPSKSEVPKDSGPTVSAQPLIKLRSRTRLAILTQLTSPYQVELFNELEATEECSLEVVYLTRSDPNRLWRQPNIRHSHVIVDASSPMRSAAATVLQEADLSIFGHYTDRFAVQNLWQRSHSGEPWCFWGERPGFFQIGSVGRLFRRLLLHPLHKAPVPIWGMGNFAIEGYQQEFGVERLYLDVPYFSDLMRFQEARLHEGRRSAEKKRFLFSGVMTERKGADLLADAFLQIARSDENIQLVMMGYGGIEERLRRKLSKVENQVEWLGFRDWEDLPAIYAGADVLCAPSRYDGWGLSVVEGLAAGLPVIGSITAGAARELIRPGENGWLINVTEPNSLRDAMLAANRLSTADLQAMSHRAQASTQGYSAREGAQVLLQAVRQVLTQWPTVQRPAVNR